MFDDVGSGGRLLVAAAAFPFGRGGIAASLAAIGFGRFSADGHLRASYPNVVRGLAFGVAALNAAALISRARHEKERKAAAATASEDAATAGERATELQRRRLA